MLSDRATASAALVDTASSQAATIINDGTDELVVGAESDAISYTFNRSSGQLTQDGETPADGETTDKTPAVGAEA